MRFTVLLVFLTLNTAHSMTAKAADALLQRGGVIGGTSAGAAIQSRVMIASGNPVPKISTGFDLLPKTIIDQHFLRRNLLPRLMTAIRANPLSCWHRDRRRHGTRRRGR